ECALLANIALQRMDRGAPASEAGDLAERAVRDDRLVTAFGADASWFLFALIVLRQADRLAAAERVLSRGLADAQARGSKRGFVLASLWSAAIAQRRGDVRR